MVDFWGKDSAGAPPKPGGVVEFRRPDGSIRRMAAYTCRHCGLARHIPDGMMIDDVAWKCSSCWGLVCPACAKTGDCKEKGEFMKQVEMHEARERLRAAAGCAEW